MRAVALASAGLVPLLAAATAWFVIGGPEAGFVGHMTVHVINIAIAAPLLAASLAQPFARWSRTHPWLSAALLASFLEFAVLWTWHTPQLHLLARDSAAAFVAEQSMFLLVSFVLWGAAFAALAAGDRRAMGVSVIALLFTSMHMTLLGALIVFAPQDLYAGSGLPAINICGLSPREDQTVGATMMLTAGATIYLIGGLRLVAAIISDGLENDTHAPGH